MRIGQQKSRPTTRRREGFSPRVARLEEKIAPAAIDLANIASAPYGIQMVGSQQGGGAGFKVVDVGDVAGTGFDDFLITAPTVVQGSLNGAPAYSLGAGATARTFLLFGSRDVSAGTIDWATISAALRTGNLGQIGTPNQSNPATGAAGYNYTGMAFFTGQSPNSDLGASVAVLGNITGNGLSSFLIGAPGATDALGQNAGTGRAYLVYGSPNLLTAVRTTQLVDLDNPSSLNSLGINVVTFVNNVPGGAAGFSVAGVGDLFANGRNDVAVGAPSVSLNGNSNNGAVYVINGAQLTTPQTGTILLSGAGQPNSGVSGVVFAGAHSGDAAGFSVAGAGSFDGATSAFGGIGDILIGAPQINPLTYASPVGPGYAAVVYGATNLPNLATANGGYLSIPLSQIGNNTVNAGLVPGAVFVGTASGDATGFAVNTAGDFNGDGVNDIMIGSPGFQSATGLVSLVYGQRATTTTSRVLGSFSLASLPSTLGVANFVGAGTGAEAGFSLGVLGQVNANPINNLLIGSPGFQSAAGAVYVIPGNQNNLTGNFSLNQATAQAAPLLATVITASNPNGPNFLGASVAGNLVPNAAGRTADSDALADFIIGAPGLTFGSGFNTAGSAFVVEGRFLPLAIPPSTSLSVTIGVNAPPPGPFTIDLAATNTISIYVLPNVTVNPVFNPFTDINPATITVNGVPFPNATITEDTADGINGVPAAIITITPATALNLANGVQTITLAGRTLATAGQSNQRFVGTAQATVSGAPSGGGGTNLPPVNPVSPTFGFPNQNAAIPVNGGQLVPTVQSLSTLIWKPLTTVQAYNQFLPGPGFRQRIAQASGLHVAGRRISSTHPYTTSKDYTLGYKVFDRSHYHPQHGNTYRLFPLKPVNHHVRTIPRTPY